MEGTKGRVRRYDLVVWATRSTCRALGRLVAIDPTAVYASAIRTPGLLPNAQIVVDHFHLVKLGNAR
jgi:transposase